MLTQLVGSLIANSIEAMESGGEILIGSDLTANGLVRAAISDNGPGIGRGDMGLLFKPFFTNKSKGLGLGLPLVRRVVERLGGSVELNSAPGKGTAVSLHLPIWK
jgi:two-component system sensor histidine kinase HydH